MDLVSMAYEVYPESNDNEVPMLKKVSVKEAGQGHYYINFIWQAQDFPSP